MMQFEGIFHAYPLDALPQFSEIARLSQEVSIVPDGVEIDCFRDLISVDDPTVPRSEVYRAPETRPMLVREGQGALLRGARSLKKPQAVEAANAVGTESAWQKCVNDCAQFTYHGKGRSAPLQEAVDTLFGQPCKTAGDFVYPPGGYRGWHTNKFDLKQTYWAMYLVQVDRPEQSFFKFLHPETDEVVTVWDQPNSVNFFRLSHEALLWHCIASEEATRWSQGFIVPDTWHDKL